MRIEEIIQWLNSMQLDFQPMLEPEIDPSLEFYPASLKQIVPHGIYFLESTWPEQLSLPHASVILSRQPLPGRNHLLIVDQPQEVHYRLTQSFMPERQVGIHPSSIISPKAIIHKGVSIGAYCVIGECTLEEDVVLKHHVIVEDKVSIGKRTQIDSHSVLGAAGMAWIWNQEGERVMQTQLGGVQIGDDCLLATDVTVVRGSLSESTRIGNGTVIAHGTKIGHGSQIGHSVHMANNVSLAGNSVISDFCFLGSASVVSSNIRLPRHTIVGAGAVVNKNYEKEYLTLAGVPAVIIKEDNYLTKPNGAPKPFKKN